MTHDKKPLFQEEDLFFEYSREQAINDGVLIDVSETAREAGFRYPVAVTSALWSDITSLPKGKDSQDVAGRLWDVLWMGYVAIRNSAERNHTLCYDLILPVGRARFYTVKLVCGPGDDASPVITLMQIAED